MSDDDGGLQRGPERDDRGAAGGQSSIGASVGKRTLTEALGVGANGNVTIAGAADPADPHNRFRVNIDDVPHRLHGEHVGPASATFGDSLGAEAATSEVPYRGEMEHAFGHDFSAVRARVGAGAPLADMGAVAAARGDEVAFASSSPGRHEVAHELTHVVQQRQAGRAEVAHLATVERSDSPAEHEADAVALRVAAGERAPDIREVPTGAIARMMIPETYEKSDPMDFQPAPLKGATALGWLDDNQALIEIVGQTNLASVAVPLGHPRLAWLGGSAALVQGVWAAVATAPMSGGYGQRLARLVAPTDLAKRVDEMRVIDEENSTDGVRRGPSAFITEIAVMVAREFERSLSASTARLGPRVVAAVDSVPDLDSPSATCGPRDASNVLPEAIVTSHPIDVLVARTLCAGGIAQVAPREIGEAEPPLDRMATLGSGGLRPVHYTWVDDPALWNWIKVEPGDASPEEVAQTLTGESSRANELRASAPFFGLPPELVDTLAPGHNAPARDKAVKATSPMGLLDALDELKQGATEDAMAGTATGEEAGLAQAATLADAPAAGALVADATLLADRCTGQVDLLVEEYADLQAGAKLGAMKARLAARRERLPTLGQAEYGRFGALFEQQSAILYDLAGALQPLLAQARQVQHAEAIRGDDEPAVAAAPGIDPTIQGLADAFLDAGAVADLPETARTRLDAARARQGTVSFDTFDAMISDARARTLSTMPIADSGPGNETAMMNGAAVANDLREREEAMSVAVLAARREQASGAASPDATKILGERAHALQVEARLVAGMTQCMYMADRLEQEFGVVAAISFQLGDLQSARNDLLRLYGLMGNVLSGWRDRHTELFASLDAGVCTLADPAAAARAAIAELEKDLSKLGDGKIQKALETANDELHDMAIAHIVVDIAVMIGLTLVTSGLGSMAAGAARGLRMGRLVVALADISTQSVAMAGLRTALYGDSFTDAFGTELLTNLAGFAALRGLAHALPTAKLGKALAVLKEGEGAWKYVAHGTELTIEAATQAGVQFAIAEGQSLIKNGRTLNDDELKMLAIQGMGMFLGNAVAHRLAAPALDHVSAYAARIGRSYRRAQVRELAARVGKTGDPEGTTALLREERALLEEERALYEELGSDKAERDAMGPETLRELQGQNRVQLEEIGRTSVEHAFQSGLTETAPGMAWEGSPAEVEPALAEARAAGAAIKTEQRPDGSLVHHVTVGEKRYSVRERALRPPREQAVLDASAKVAAAEAAPGSGVVHPPTAVSAQLLEASRADAADPTSAAQVLDQLNARLDPLAQAGLKAYRHLLGDEGALAQVEEKVGAQDLSRFFAEKGMSADARAKAVAQVFAARAELARAVLRQKNVLDDASVRARVELDAARVIAKLGSDAATSAPRIEAEVNKNLAEVVAELGESLARAQLRTEFGAEPNREIISNIELVEEIPGFATLKEWQAAQRELGKSDQPRGRYEADGKLWKSMTEVDNMVVVRSPDGKLAPLVLEQVKTGVESKADAVSQNETAMKTLHRIAGGEPGVEMYDRVSKNTLGARRTPDFDLNGLSSVTSRATGLPGKDFQSPHAILDLGSPGLGAKDAREILVDISRDLLNAEVARLLTKPKGP